MTNRLREISAEPVAEIERSDAPSPPPADNASLDILFLALKALSQRAIIAFGQLFSALTCLSAFVLWYNVLENPNAEQLVGVALYGCFILLLHLVLRKRG